MNSRIPPTPSPDPERELDRLMQSGRYSDVVQLFASLPKHIKRQAGPVNAYGCALIVLGECDKAVRVLTDVPFKHRTADIWNNLGVATLQLGRTDEALVLLNRALTRFPDNQALNLTRSKCLNALGRFHDAYDAALTAMAIAKDPVSLLAAARASERLHRIDEAIGYYRVALDLDPGDGAAANNLNNLYMQTYRFADAWDLAELRMQSPTNRRLFRKYFSAACPAWTGGPLAGRRLHVIGDQGIGDEIMFSQFLLNLGPLLPDKVIVYPDPRLIGFFAGGFNVDFDIAFEAFPETPGFGEQDLKVSLSSLPNYVARSEDRFPRKPFVFHPTEGPQIRGGGGRRVFGLSWWSSGLAGTERSLNLTELAEALGAQDADFLSLQYDPEGADLAGLKKRLGDRLIVIDGLDCTDDFIGIAKTAMRLDGIVSIPNTTVHIAGAIGVPTGVLLPAEPSWRYVSPDEHMIWHGDHVRLIGDSDTGDLKSRIGSFIDRITG